MNNLDWDQLLSDCVDFTQRLIQTPSMSHEEAQIAELVAAEMRKLKFEDVEIDGIGNVSGRIRGQNPDLGALVLNTPSGPCRSRRSGPVACSTLRWRDRRLAYPGARRLRY